MNSIKDIRTRLAAMWVHGKFVTDKTGVHTVEIINACFKADEDHIFGEVNQDYVLRELSWYQSMLLNVNDIPGGAPAIWKQVADPDGFINSNYGWCVFSKDNNYQFDHVVTELEMNPDSRRANMIYTRPEMWGDHNKNGRSDFMCTNNVQYVIRDKKIHAMVYMRSNDAWAGYRNDYAWQKYVLERLVRNLEARSPRGYEVGDIYWNVGSLHVYSRQFYLLDHYMNTGESSITKADYDELYKVG